MAKIKSVLRHLCRDEAGTETLEFAIVCGLIAVACIGVCAAIGPKVLARWSSINSSV